MSSVERLWSEGPEGLTGGERVTDTSLIYTLHTETHTPAESLYLFTLFPHTGTVLYIVSMGKARGL